MRSRNPLGVDANPLELRRYDRTISKLGGIAARQPDDSLTERMNGTTNQSNDAGVGNPTNDRELTEILVEGDQNSAFCMRPLKDFRITGIAVPVARPRDVVPRGANL